MKFNALLCLMLFSLGISGCMGPISLHKAVLGYDETISRLAREMLLINIARTHRNIPTHFTVTSRIAATFDYQTNTGLTGTIFERASGINNYALNLGVSVSENPTLSIIPMQGEEFTRRILMPLDEKLFQFLVFQGASVDMVMRLMARGIEVQEEDGTFQRFIMNWPIYPDEYKEFRRIALHLAWLNANRNLFASRLSFEEVVLSKLSGAPSANDIMKADEKGYHWNENGDDGTYELTKQTNGRVVIANYDPLILTNRERHELNNLAARKPNNFVLVDIRAGYPGGSFPLFGSIKLRSFNEIIEFLAAGIDSSQEFNVDPDPRTGKVIRNPRTTLAITVDEPLPQEVLRISFGGHDYAIGQTPWDYKAFKLLYHLFQTTVTDVSGMGVPITISK